MGLSENVVPLNLMVIQHAPNEMAHFQTNTDFLGSLVVQSYPIITIATFSVFRHRNLHIFPLDPSFSLLTATSFVGLVELQTNAQFEAEYQTNFLPGYPKGRQNMFCSFLMFVHRSRFVCLKLQIPSGYLT